MTGTLVCHLKLRFSGQLISLTFRKFRKEQSTVDAAFKKILSVLDGLLVLYMKKFEPLTRFPPFFAKRYLHNPGRL